MTKAEERQAAEVLKRVVEGIDQGEVEAPAWYRERLAGAMLALDPDAQAESALSLSLDEDVADVDRGRVRRPGVSFSG